MCSLSNDKNEHENINENRLLEHRLPFFIFKYLCIKKILHPQKLSRRSFQIKQINCSQEKKNIYIQDSNGFWNLISDITKI